MVVMKEQFKLVHSIAQNFKEVLTPKKEDTEFEKLVKRNIERN